MTNELVLKKIDDLERRIASLEFKLVSSVTLGKRCKLTIEQQKEILEQYKAGRITQRELGVKYGVSNAYIQTVIARAKYYA